jgi:hypothetical protein
MNLLRYCLGCSGILAINFLFSSFSSPSVAQCVQADMGVQMDVSAGKADQTYDRNMRQEGPCAGNASITTGVQVNTTGSGRHQQKRQVNQTMTGGSGNGTGINGPVIQHGVNIQVDLDNPADGYNPSLPSIR